MGVCYNSLKIKLPGPKEPGESNREASRLGDVGPNRYVRLDPSSGHCTRNSKTRDDTRPDERFA